MSEAAERGGRRKDPAVLVSDAMFRFRRAHSRLNAMLWSTEICYSHVLESAFEPEAAVWETFAHTKSNAWFPNREGKLKYDKNVGEFREDVETNMRHLHKNVLVEYYTHFEAYLASKLKIKKGKSAAPFLWNVGRSPHFAGPYQPRPVTLLLADVSRCIRNRIVHHDRLPKAPNDKSVEEIVLGLSRYGKADERAAIERQMSAWGVSEARIADWVNDFVRGVSARCDDEGGPAADIRRAFFYTLFTFTHFDALAFELEDATFDPARAAKKIFRKRSRIRNKAMIAE